MRRVAPILLLAMGFLLAGTPVAIAHETIETCRSHTNIGPTGADGHICVRINETCCDFHEALSVRERDDNGTSVDVYVQYANLELWADTDNDGTHSDAILVDAHLSGWLLLPYPPTGSNYSTHAFDAIPSCDQWQARGRYRLKAVYPSGQFVSGYFNLTSRWTVC